MDTLAKVLVDRVYQKIVNLVYLILKEGTDTFFLQEGTDTFFLLNKAVKVFSTLSSNKNSKNL